jgi:hypothetical protein
MNKAIFSFVACGLSLAVLLSPTREARADAQGVGLGVAAGVDLYNEEKIDTSTSFSWGFFVDIPLLDTFFITPSTTIYELDLGNEEKIAITDVDLNFKFIVPLGRLRLGAGVLAGLTTGLGDYLGHFGLLGYGSLALVENLDLFVMVQYKRLQFGDANIDNYHGFGGVMFRF